MKVEFYLGIGLACADRREIVEFPEDTTEEEIQECFNDWMNDYLDCYWAIRR